MVSLSTSTVSDIEKISKKILYRKARQRSHEDAQLVEPPSAGVTVKTG